ncbi:MAG: hypothetical protein ABJD11_01110 [Gemmatimonadota bacterium]
MSIRRADRGSSQGSASMASAPDDPILKTRVQSAELRLAALTGERAK